MTERRCAACGSILRGGDSPACPRCAFRAPSDGSEDETLAHDDSLARDVGDGAGGVTDRIDRYVLIEKIGEGGMGEVWLAEQKEPVRRRVALKIIKPGLDAAGLIARFEGERQALALMDHPAVAKMLDAGTTPEGRPFFVMEYVRGRKITEYCDRRRLNVPQRLELMRQVCDGVQHAHQRGIVHRDLKPSNVLVATQDGEAIPKIIDFGIAKAVGPKITEHTMLTQLGSLVGTPGYMSPEQAGVGASTVDTRTDVYTLGVLLYELLSGFLPFEPEELLKAGYEEILRMIREVDPPRPSVRVEREGEGADLTAAGRGTDRDTLARQLRDDLDWIVMKALEKDRDRRYSSAAELSSDLQRHLSHEPVLAGPPSAAYRARKFARRHRTAVAVSITALVLLVGGLVATTWLWTLARDRYAQVMRLADLKRVRDYSAEADHLWPAHPEKIEALERWLRKKGEPLANRLPVHRATLEALRARAAPYGEEEREADRASHPDLRRLQDERDYVEQTRERIEDARASYHQADRDEVIEYYESRVEEALDLIEELEVKVRERRTWAYEDEETTWQHEMLTDLVDELQRFTDADPFVGSLASVQARLEFARTIGERSVSGEEAGASWAAASEAIASSPRYDGLRLVPQMGLVPLGPDHRSGLWEFWHVASGERPRPSPEVEANSRWLMGPETGMVFVLIPGGSFMMGAQKDDPGDPNFDPNAQQREARVHRVELDPFFLSKYEMTQGQWMRLAGRNPSRMGVGETFGERIATEANPVEMMTWAQAEELMGRQGLALPTEAQWEYAARAGTEGSWWTGSDPLTLRGAANLVDLAMKENRGPPSWTYEEWLDDGYAIHAPVGSYRANPWGLHEVVGNVAEWCRDYYQSPYRKQIAPGDGLRLIPGATKSHVARGGGYRSLAVEARSGTRSNIPTQRPDSNTGLRPARKILGPAAAGGDPDDGDRLAPGSARGVGPVRNPSGPPSAE